MEEGKLTTNDTTLLISLVQAEKSGIDLLRGFRKPNKKEQKQISYYNRLIKKLNCL